MKGVNNFTRTVLVYTPEQDIWDELPPPPIWDFTVATLSGRLLVVGGRDKSTLLKTNTILAFDERSRRWVQSLPPMPVAIAWPACSRWISGPSDCCRWT